MAMDDRFIHPMDNDHLYSIVRLAKTPSGLSHFNLEGVIVQKRAHASEVGDVYTAWSKRHDKKVAVKQIRAFLIKDPSLAKVRLVFLDNLHDSIMTDQLRFRNWRRRSEFGRSSTTTISSLFSAIISKARI